MKYPSLFSPITIRGKTFRNRILVAPMGLQEEDNDGAMTKRGVEFYEDLAKGGAARICCGENDIAPCTAIRGMYHFYVDTPTEKFKQSIRDYAAVCHENGALAFASFNHTGIYMRVMTPGKKPAAPPPPPGGAAKGGKGAPPPGGMAPMPLRADGTRYEMPKVLKGPSPMEIHAPHDGITRYGAHASDSNDGKVVEEYTEEDLLEIADQYAHCAAVCKELGLDGMIIHGGHGFLFGQFVSRRINHRTDQYGGSAENRARFPILCLQRIRDRVGEDFIVELRFSGEENVDPISSRRFLEDALTIDDTVAFFQEVDKHPGLLDIAHISGGIHTIPSINTRVTANSYWPMGPNVACAAAVKRAVKHIQVAVVGSLSDPAFCEEVIRTGKADFVVMARQLQIADPEMPNKALRGDDDEINSCLRCVSCQSNGYCAINPVNWMMDDRDTLHIIPAAVRKRVAVVGGGIGGMKAAEYAARRGHKVVLFEKNTELGGILRYAKDDRHKVEIAQYIEKMGRRLQNLGVELRMDTPASLETVRNEQPDAVILALGGKPRLLPIQGGGLAVNALDAYFHPEKVGLQVAIIGGGLTGCEAAIHWLEQGRKVTIISRNPELLANVSGDRENANTHLILLDELHAEIRTGVACREILPGCVVLEDGVRLDTDTVINASGMAPDPDSVAVFSGAAPVVESIGDCQTPGLIGDAVRGAYLAAMRI